jgi:iron-sulfur cluster insertion protein
VTISDAAARRLAEVVAAEPGAPGAKMSLRISVSGGGCAGFQYGFTLDAVRNDDDIVFERDGVAVVIDGVSLDLLGGAQVDFVEDLSGASFLVRNPNATSSCGCGNSFSI